MYTITDIVLFGTTFYVSLICGLLHLRMAIRNDSILGKKVLLLAVLASMASAGGSMFLILDVTMPRLYMELNPLIIPIYMSINLLYYNFIFEMTKVYNDEKFPVIHYFFPIAIALILLACAYYIPDDIRMSLMHSSDFEEPSYKIYSLLFSAKPAMYFIWKIAYALLGLQRTIRFRKAVVNYSADEQRTSLTWLYQFLFVMLAALPLGWAIIYFSDREEASLLLMALLMLIVMFKDVILVHNILLDNLVVVQFETKEEENIYAKKEISTGDIKQLDAYMRKTKPYLNPKLKITEIVQDLNTNRTSLSSFINKTYNMNFSRYINLLRLEELEKLKSDPAHSELSELELIVKAGFSDYRGYKRVKEREKK